MPLKHESSIRKPAIKQERVDGCELAIKEPLRRKRTDFSLDHREEAASSEVKTMCYSRNEVTSHSQQLMTRPLQQ